MKEFLEHWQSNPDSRDAAKTLFIKHQEMEAELIELKKDVLRFIVPVRGNKKAWDVGFDDSHIDEVTELASKIGEISERQKSLSNDIKRFEELSGFKIETLENKLRSAQRRLEAAERTASGALRQSSKAHPGVALEEIQSDAKVVAAYQKLGQIQRDPALSEIKSKLKEAREILKRWN